MSEATALRDISICFFDLDGTLLSEDHETVSARTEAALHTAHDAGIRLCIATGRSHAILPNLSHLPFDCVITSNGADARAQSGESIHTGHLSAEDARIAWEILAPHNLFIEWYVGNEIAVDRRTHQRLHMQRMPIWHRQYFEQGSPVFETTEAFLDRGADLLEKINLPAFDAALRLEIWNQLLETGRFELSSSLGRNIEINALGCTKGKAIREVCKSFGMESCDAAAFGDGGNDIEMLSIVGHGVAMGNAVEGAKQAARYVTGTNAEDGVALFLERLLTQKKNA